MMKRYTAVKMKERVPRITIRMELRTASENGLLRKQDTLSIKLKVTNYTHAYVMINFKRNKHGIRDEDDGVWVRSCWGGGTTWLDVGYRQDSGFRLSGGWFHGVYY